jgi:2-hydroxychromene-2-carboxylate isomerase
MVEEGVMSKTIELIFDFVSPNAYLVWYPLKALAANYDADILVTPVFLGGMHKLTGNAPPFVRDADVKGKNAYAMLEMQRFIIKYGLSKWQMNPKFPFNSIALQRLLTACSPDQRIAIIDALLPPIWEQQADVSDTALIAAALTNAGFDAETLMTATQDDAIKQALITNTEQAVERGAFGIPTFFIGTEMFFGKERLGQIEDMLAAL